MWDNDEVWRFQWPAAPVFFSFKWEVWYPEAKHYETKTLEAQSHLFKAKKSLLAVLLEHIFHSTLKTRWWRNKEVNRQKQIIKWIHRFGQFHGGNLSTVSISRAFALMASNRRALMSCSGVSFGSTLAAAASSDSAADAEVFSWRAKGYRGQSWGQRL